MFVGLTALVLILGASMVAFGVHGYQHNVNDLHGRCMSAVGVKMRGYADSYCDCHVSGLIEALGVRKYIPIDGTIFKAFSRSSIGRSSNQSFMANKQSLVEREVSECGWPMIYWIS